MKAVRNHKAYWAFIGHRVSGLALAVFLPFHFLALGLALEGAAPLDGFLKFAELPLVKVAEWGLVIFLGLHLAFGIRLLVLEFFPWRATNDARLSWVGWGTGLAMLVGVVFLMGVF